MTKEEFKTKYSNTVIKVVSDLTIKSAHDKSSEVCEIISEAGLFYDVSLCTSQTEAQEYIILIPCLVEKGKYSDTELPQVLYTDFLKDYESVRYEYKIKIQEIIENILDKIDIPFYEYKKSSLEVSYIVQHFIQAETNMSYSIWWHIDGRFVLILRGVGVFDLLYHE